MMDTSLLVVGAGPYGLSVGACAKDAGIDTIVLGEPMDFWRRNMPEGMILRSGIDWHLDANGAYTIEAYLAERGLEPAEVLPLPIHLFIEYATWFQASTQLPVRHSFAQEITRARSL